MAAFDPRQSAVYRLARQHTRALLAELLTTMIRNLEDRPKNL